MTSPYTAVNEVRTTHTLGPWRVEETRNARVVIKVVGPDMEICKRIERPGYVQNEARANARLIAAAPELLAELKRINEHFSAFAADHSMEASTETWAALHCAKAAIASAESSS